MYSNYIVMFIYNNNNDNDNDNQNDNSRNGRCGFG